MTIIKCPKCGKDTLINIAKAYDEEGESFACDHCQFIFRYAPKY